MRGLFGFLLGVWVASTAHAATNVVVTLADGDRIDVTTGL